MNVLIILSLFFTTLVIFAIPCIIIERIEDVRAERTKRKTYFLNNHPNCEINKHGKIYKK